MSSTSFRPKSPGPRLSPARLAALALALFAAQAAASAQSTGIGAHRGEIGGTGGNRSIQGRVMSPTGRLPDSRIRISVESSNAGARTAVTDADGTFQVNNLDTGPYQVIIDAGKEYEVIRESIYIGATTQTFNLPIYLRLKPEANPALAGVPRPAVDLFLKGYEEARKGNNEKAAAHLSEAVAQHPQFGLAHKELGAVYLRTNQLDKAAESLKAAAAAMPNDPEAQLDYGIVLVQKKDFAGAEPPLRAALKQRPESASAHMYLGIALAGLKDLEGAEAELRQAIKLGGDRMGAAHKYLGGIYWGKRDYKRAADELEAYLKLTPKAPDAERTRAAVKELRSKQ